MASTATLGCPDETQTDDEVGDGSLLPGDLVISEIMADPEGADEGQEWLEIYNATGATMDLQGLTLVYSKADGTGRKTHTVARSVEIPSGAYVVVGGLLDELAPATGFVDYGFANELGAFGNTAGYLAIEDAKTIIDEVYYEEATSGASRAFDGSKAPDASVNDSLAEWCDSKTEFAPNVFATPGVANDFCSQDGCLEDGELRPVVSPTPGQLLINEVHANPKIVGDTEGEWFELLALADFDLNGLSFGKAVGEEAEETFLIPSASRSAPATTSSSRARAIRASTAGSRPSP
ncbi:MAG: lamin tail domain-containing protein [Deltaproteobacteria bacterium]|nr:lamin tail domain-containing protein [Deltaproteobacteria bacterium]